MKPLNPVLVASWAILTTAALSAAMVRMIWYTPPDVNMGELQKIFYLHLPVAICTFLACLVCFIGSIGYLASKRMFWDDLALAGGRVGAQLCTVVLATGMIWGRGAWGLWWTWSPRLTFSLVLWLLYVVYLLARMSVQSRQRRAMISGVYGVVAFLDVPLVYLSVKLMPDIHPASIALAPEMQLTLLVWFIPVTLLTLGLLIGNYKVNQARRAGQDSTAPAFEVVTPGKFNWTGSQP